MSWSGIYGLEEDRIWMSNCAFLLDQGRKMIRQEAVAMELFGLKNVETLYGEKAYARVHISLPPL